MKQCCGTCKFRVHSKNTLFGGEKVVEWDSCTYPRLPFERQPHRSDITVDEGQDCPLYEVKNDD